MNILYIPQCNRVITDQKMVCYPANLCHDNLCASNCCNKLVRVPEYYENCRINDKIQKI
jgi:hypothetical protein